MKKEVNIFLVFVTIFLIAYFLSLATPQFEEGTPSHNAKVTTAVVEAFVLCHW